MLYKINNYVKRKKDHGYHVHVFEVSSLDAILHKTLEIKAFPGTELDNKVEEHVSRTPYFTAENEDFKKDVIKVMIGALWEYGFASAPELSHPSRMPKLSNKAEIHAIELCKGNYNGKQFKSDEDETVEKEILERYNLQGCSEQDEYSDFLRTQGVSILKEGSNYRIIEVPKGQFKITFSF